MRDWFDVRPLAVILAFGAALRLDGFARVPLWLDEYGTSWVVAGGSLAEVASRAIERHGQSPLYYWITWLSVTALGDGPVGLRLPSVLLGIGALWLIYDLTLALLCDRRAALLAALAAALSEPLIWYAQDARPYSLALVLGLASLRLAMAAAERPTAPKLAGWAIFSTATFYAHYLFSPIVLVGLAHVAIERRLGKRWVLATGIALFACVPGVMQLASLFARRASLDWIGPQPWAAPVRVVADFFAPPALAVVVTLLALGGQRTPVPARHLRTLALWFALPIALFALAPLAGAHLAYNRYLLFLAPAACAVLGVVLASAARPRLAIAGFILAVLAFELGPARAAGPTFSQRPREGWAEAAGWLAPRLGEKDLILLRTGLVEADVVATADPDQRFLEYLSWPLAKELGHAGQILTLPARLDDTTRHYLGGIIELTRSRERVWVVGDGALVGEVARTLAGRGLALRERERFGNVQVFGASLGSPETP